MTQQKNQFHLYNVQKQQHQFQNYNNNHRLQQCIFQQSIYQQKKNLEGFASQPINYQSGDKQSKSGSGNNPENNSETENDKAKQENSEKNENDAPNLQGESLLSETSEMMFNFQFDPNLYQEDTPEFQEKLQNTVQFYTSNFCPNAQMVQIAIKEKNIPSEQLKFIEGFRIQDKLYEFHEDFEEINHEVIPTIKHQNQLIQGSIRILRHLDEQFGEKTILHGDDLDIHSAGDIAEVQYRVVSELNQPFYRMLMRPEKEAQDKEKQLFLSIVENILNLYKGPFLQGDLFTVADIAMAPFFARMFVLKHYRNFEVPHEDKYQKWHEWSKNVLARKSVKSSIADKKYILEMYQRYADNNFRGQWYQRTFQDDIDL